MKRLPIFLSLILLLCLAAPDTSAGKDTARQAHTEQAIPATAFERFSAVLPQGWTGEDRSAFHTGRKEEYMLSLGKKGEKAVEAQLTVFILPNEKKQSAKDLAGQLAQLQDHASAIAEKDGFWSFSGEPRSKISSGEALTRVRATPDLMLVIVSQDPRNLGAEKVFQSLVPLTPDAIRLFERR